MDHQLESIDIGHGIHGHISLVTVGLIFYVAYMGKPYVMACPICDDYVYMKQEVPFEFIFYVEVELMQVHCLSTYLYLGMVLSKYNTEYV